MTRPSWDAYFSEIARVVAKRATCGKKSVGAVFTRENLILTTGYNGAPAGEPHCDHTPITYEPSPFAMLRDTDLAGHCVTAVHAELNAVLQAARQGISLHGATLYVTHPPCDRCSLLLKQLGLERIVCPT